MNPNFPTIELEKKIDLTNFDSCDYFVDEHRIGVRNAQIGPNFSWNDIYIYGYMGAQW